MQSEQSKRKMTLTKHLFVNEKANPQSDEVLLFSLEIREI